MFRAHKNFSVDRDQRRTWDVAEFILAGSEENSEYLPYAVESGAKKETRDFGWAVSPDIP